MKKIFLTVFVLFILLFAINVYAADVSVIINGREVKADTEPIMEYDRVFLPIRATFESLGCEVNWDESTNTATATLGDKTVSLVSGASEINVSDGSVIKMDCPSIERNDRIYIPVRFASEAFGFNVIWSDALSVAAIYKENCSFYDDGFGVPVYSDIIESAVSSDTKYLESDGYAYITGYDEVTDYLMNLQDKFGFDYYNTEFNENYITQIYENTATMCYLSLSSGMTDDGYAAVIEIESFAPQQKFTPNMPEFIPPSGEEIPPAQVIPEEPYTPNEPQADDVEYYENTNNTLPTYTYVTGVELTEKTSDDNADIYKYSGGFFGATEYSTMIMFYGNFREYNTDMDFESITRYYTNGDIIFGIITSFFNDEVWIVIPKAK